MSEDASFRDGDEHPLRLIARDSEDLVAISALVQDAILPANEMKWVRKKRQFSLLVNRYRWEDPAARNERVQAVLSFHDVFKVRSAGISPDSETVLSLMALAWIPDQDGMGQVELTFSGDGTLVLHVECLEVWLRDVSRPYEAPSGQAPKHLLD